MSAILMFAPSPRAFSNKEAIPTLAPSISNDPSKEPSYLEAVERQREHLMGEKDYLVRERQGLTLLRGDWRLAWVEAASNADEVERSRLYARCRHEQGLVFLSIANGYATSPIIDECYGKRRMYLARAAEALQNAVDHDSVTLYQFNLGLVYKWLNLNGDALRSFEKVAASGEIPFAIAASREVERLGKIAAPIEAMIFDDDEEVDADIEALSPTQEFLKRLINERGFSK